MPVPWDAMVPAGIILVGYALVGQVQYHGTRLLNEGKVRPNASVFVCLPSPLTLSVPWLPW